MIPAMGSETAGILPPSIKGKTNKLTKPTKKLTDTGIQDILI